MECIITRVQKKDKNKQIQSKFTENFSKCSKKFCLSLSFRTMSFPLTILSCIVLSWSQDGKFCSVWAWRYFFRLEVSDCVSQQPKPLRNINPISLQEENNEFESKRLNQELQRKKWKRWKGLWGEKSKGNSRNCACHCVTFRPRLHKRWIF